MTTSPEARVLPRWCGVADAIAAACAVAAFVLLVAGTYRDVWFGTTISIGWLHAAFAALALTAVRHAAVSSPSLFVSLDSWWRAVANRPALADAMTAFWLTRPTVLLVGFFAVITIGVTPQAADVLGARDPLATLPARFDAGWYAGIAIDGYEWQYRFDRQQNLAFFPAYPLLMRAAAAATGAFRPGVPPERRLLRVIRTGLLISLASFFWALWYFSRLAHQILDAPHASLAVILLTAYPFALFYSAAYTESLYLLAAVGAWYHFRRRDWVTCALWGVLAGLSRPNGFLLSLPLGLLALGVPDARAGADRLSRQPLPAGAFAAAGMPAAGMLVFTAYTYHLTGVWFAWLRMNAAWGRVLAVAVPGTPDTTWNAGAGLLSWAAQHPYGALNSLGLLFALGLIWPVWRRLGAAWATFVAASVLLPLLSGGLLSMGRITSTIFPLFLALSALLSTRASAGCVAAFGVLQGLCAALFFTWRELF